MKTLMPQIFGQADEKTLEQMKTCMAPEFAVAGALMADNHLGYSMPIGGVIAYRDHISPSGVGYDIACGNKAVQTNLTYAEIQKDLPKIMDQIAAEISFGIGRSNTDPEAGEQAFFEEHSAWDIKEINKLKQKARAQLGTVGSGNHYVDLFATLSRGDIYIEDKPLYQGESFIDPTAPVWIGVHFGSRGLGHTIASGYMSMAKGGSFDERVKGEGMMDDPILIAADSTLGQYYLEGMNLAGVYAYAGRNYVVNRVLDILGAEETYSVHNHHNFAWLEEHDGEKVWVVRKGATPAYPGQTGFIGGSMGDISVIIEGVESEDAARALHSTVHGAGRVMSRTKAAGKIRRRKRYACNTRDCDRVFDIDGVSAHYGVPKKGICPDHPDSKVRKIWVQEQVSPGVVDFPSWQAKLAASGIELRGGGADEAPEVYKSLRNVLDAHSETIKIKAELTPIGVVMAGANVYDPFKD